MTQKLRSRREFLKSMGAGTALLSLGGSLYRCGRSRRRPNILFIMADDHDRGALSCYGSRINQTPHLDRLAREGMLFRNCFCTNSICAPSRAAILTGLYSHLNGIRDNGSVFDGSQTTFPKLLRKSGYETAMIGKWHLKSDPTGFDYWNVLPGQGNYHDPEFIEMGEKKQHSGYVTDLITDFSIRWLETRDEGKPFCLMCHHKAPHRNWQPDDEHASLYEDEAIPEPETFNDDYSTRSDAARQQEMTIENHLLVPYDTKIEPPPHLEGQALKKWKYQRYIKDYLRCIASVDKNVGRLLAFLDEKGLAENTLVIYTSDQGFYLGDHGWFDKRFMYEESLHMPMLARHPGFIPEGSVCEEMVLNIDFAPTFLDLAGISPPDAMQGQSIQPLLRGKKPGDWRKAMYYHYYEFPAVHMVKRHYGIRTARYKLIHYYYDIDAWELYDLRQDPHELNNLYGNPEYADLVSQLKEKLRLLQAGVGDSDTLAREFLRKDLEAREQRRKK
jgi:arylsulfatase A-like enzyme